MRVWFELKTLINSNAILFMMTSSNQNIFHWPFVRGIDRFLVNSLHKSQWRGALMFSLVCVWVNDREAGDLKRYRACFDVTVMLTQHHRDYFRYLYYLSARPGNPISHLLHHGPQSHPTHRLHYLIGCHTGAILLSLPGQIRYKDEIRCL